MLYAAAGLTIDLARELLPCGFGIKDATPYNVLFRGPEPVFVDVLSFEPRDPHDPLWLPYAQFVRTFLLPLALSRSLDLPLDQVFLARRDGIEPAEAYRWLPRSLRFRRPFLSLVTIPVWLARRQNPDDTAFYRPRPMSDPGKARLVLERLLAGLRRTVDRLQPATAKASTWSGYRTRIRIRPRPRRARPFRRTGAGRVSPGASARCRRQHGPLQRAGRRPRSLRGGRR